MADIEIVKRLTDIAFDAMMNATHLEEEYDADAIEEAKAIVIRHMDDAWMGKE